jgi:hypothetical protein
VLAPPPRQTTKEKNEPNETETLALIASMPRSGSGGDRDSAVGSRPGTGGRTTTSTSQDAEAKQNAVNANVPVSIAGDDAYGGDSSADQDADNSADADAENKSLTIQLAAALQRL